MIENISKESTIQEIVRQGLCIGCGTCITMCPEKALILQESQESGIYLPRLDPSKCIHCGVCHLVCPGIEADFNKLNFIAFDQKSKYAFLGNYLSCYSGYATDQNLRAKSTSGGLISALAIFALETGLVDGVLTTRANLKKPLKPYSFIAKTKQEVLSAIGSKYCPISTNSALDKILKKQGRYIVIGLPCHIQGIRKAQALNKELKNRISLIFGMVCNHTPTFHAINFLLKKFKIRTEHIVKLDYRSNGWPGGIKIVMDNGSKYVIPFSSSYYWGYVFQKFFWPKRCMICNDKLCQLADIIFMDAWLPEFSFDKIGHSLIVVRSIKGKNFLTEAIKKDVLKLQPISIEQVLQSQVLSKTIQKVIARRLILRYPSKDPFVFKQFLPSSSILDLLDAFHLVLIHQICKKTSKMTLIIIEFHVGMWDFARVAKRTIIKFKTLFLTFKKRFRNFIK